MFRESKIIAAMLHFQWKKTLRNVYLSRNLGNKNMAEEKKMK